MPLPDLPPLPADLLPALLDLLPTGVVYYTPLHDAAGPATNFALTYLNPAAQRLLGLPARPDLSLAQLLPDPGPTGALAQHRAAWQAADGPASFAFDYPAGGAAQPVRALARRQGEGLLVLLNYADQVSEEALRASQAREQAARAEAERQRGELQRVFEQAPLAIAVYRGPNYVIELANATLCRLWGRTPAQLIGLGLFEALPEVAGMGFEELLDGVMATGIPHVAREMPAFHDRNGRRETVYWDFVYEPMRNAEGQIDEAMVVANEVTEQVLARQQLQTLNEELEMRVTARSAEARAALHEAEEQREQLRLQQGLLRQILGQVPAAIATLSGPQHRFMFFNDHYQALVGGRAVLGQPVEQVLPEVAEQGFTALLDRVYATGQPFVGSETLVLLRDQHTDHPTQLYLDLIYQPLFDERQQMQGILAFILDVTEKVRSRKQAETLQAAMLAVAQRQAQERQDLYQLFEQTPAAIVLLREPDHRIDYFNAAFTALFPPEEWTGPLRGHTLAEVYPRIKQAGLMALIDEVYRTGESQLVPEMPLADLQPGSPRFVTLAYQAYREQGRTVGVAAFVYDVTEQVQARREREARQAELQRIFEQAPVAIAILRGPDLLIELANASACAIWGRPAAQLLGRPYFEALPDTAGQGFEAILGNILTTGATFSIAEAPVQIARAHTGQPALGYFDLAFQPLHDERGQVSGIIVIGTEVTVQVTARQAVEANARQLRLLTDALPVLIAYLDRDHVYRFTNEAYRDWFGQDPAALLGRPVREVVGEAAYQVVLPRIEQALAGERVDFDARMPYREDFVKHIHTSYIPDVQAGEVRGFYTLVTDVTDQVQAREQVLAINDEIAAVNREMRATNDELAAANTQLTRTNADLDTFVYTASHDLKAPIINVEGLLLALRDHLPPAHQLDPLVPRLLTMMDGAVARFQQTLAHLTGVSRLQQSRLEQPAEYLDLPALVEAVRLDMAPEMHAAGATLVLDLAGCPTVRFPAKNLRSVIYNLLSNAIKYHAPGRPPQVTLRAHQTAGRAVLTVQDNGLGLTLDQQGQLFQMFRRLHHHVPGSGVGLYMVKKMVENEGGTINVVSEPGAGSIFTVSLPGGP